MANPKGHPANLMPPWQPGQSGNPGGSTMPARRKLTARFIYQLAEDFAEHGPKAIAKARKDDPVGYLRVIASLAPKELELANDPFEDMSDDELRSVIDLVRRTVATRSGADGAGSRRGETVDVEPAGELRALPEATPVPRGGGRKA